MQRDDTVEGGEDGEGGREERGEICTNKEKGKMKEEEKKKDE